jgi:hypothetical protein
MANPDKETQQQAKQGPGRFGSSVSGMRLKPREFYKQMMKPLTEEEQVFLDQQDTDGSESQSETEN